jgi:hypothetical protein
MIPFALPQNDRQIVVRSFWVVISFIGGFAAWLVGWFVRFPYTIALAALIAAALYLFVFWNEPFVRRLYHAWNNRIIIPMARIVGEMIMRFCLFVIFAVTGRLGSRLRVDPHTSSIWENRNSLPPDAYILPFPGVGGSTQGRGWIRGYVRWAKQSRNVWALALIPFLTLLRIVIREERPAMEGSIYTLF